MRSLLPPKYHPDVVAIHCSKLDEYLVAATSTTFGDGASPLNLEPVAWACHQLARHLWHQPDTIERAEPYLPQIDLSPTPTPEELATFVPAKIDSLNPRVLDAQGNHLPPQFDYHVDDNTDADIAKNTLLAVSASVLALWILLGFPDKWYPNPLSMDKLITRYSHQRVTLGYKLDSRKMEVEVLPSRCEAMIVELAAWIDTTKTSFTLRELASLHGTLENMTHYVAWS